MQYHPKLKVAMQEIKEILRKHDIAGAIALHLPGFSEYHLRIDPSYSCAKFEQIDGQPAIRIRSKLQEDHNGDKEAQNKALTDTANMFHLLARAIGVPLMSIIDVSEDLDKKLDTEHFDHGHTGHTEQNN